MKLSVYHRLMQWLPMAACILSALFLPPAARASSASQDSVFHGVVLEDAQLLREYRPVAGKNAADLNVGEPRTVRMIFFRPGRSHFRPSVVDSMKVAIRRVQAFFVKQMRSHGHGYRPFLFETDAEGEPIVHQVIGQRPPQDYYSSPHSSIGTEIDQRFDTEANVYLVVADHVGLRGGLGSRRAKTGGMALVGPGLLTHVTTSPLVLRSHMERFILLVAHELGHAFGLQHDFRDDAYLMSYGPYWGKDRISACASEFLAVHPYFNRNIPLKEEDVPTVELISSDRYPSGSTSVLLQFKVGAAKGLHQLIVYHPNVTSMRAGGYPEVYVCRSMAGEVETQFEFEYGTGVSLRVRNRLFDNKTQQIWLQVTDTGGNVTTGQFKLTERSTHEIATLEGHGGRVLSVAFSPDGMTLASTHGDSNVRLWNVASGEEVRWLRGHGHEASSVAFSPDGTILASAHGDSNVRLWNVATEEEIATLAGHGGRVLSVAFSPDGTTLASSHEDGNVRLWDVASGEEIDRLRGHEASSVAFSLDGTILASGHYVEGVVRLWEVATGEEIATLEGHVSWVSSVAFSPDGTILASGSFDHTIKLWDVATGEEIATLEGHAYLVKSVAFSPDGTVLASGSLDRTVRLWDTLLKEEIVSFLNTAGFNSVAFSPEGRVLAAGTDEGTIVIWDMSAFVTPSNGSPDVNGDGTVDFGDFVLFSQRFGTSRGDAGYDSRYDLDGDGTIGFSDFVIFAGAFGQDA